MTILYLDRKSMRIGREGQAIVLRDGDERLTTVPIHMLERVVIHGNAQVDVFLFYHLALEGVSTVILGRGRERVALVQGPAGKDASRRILQYRLYGDSEWRRHWAREVVRLKLMAHSRLLRRMVRERPDRRRPLYKAMEVIDAGLQTVGSEPRGIDRLRGIEGAAAQAAFSAYTSLFPASLDFHGRNRRPPRDPVNVLLSLGYTMLHAEALLACHRHGLDPVIGFYHELAHGRDSLACDLMEPFRPRVDRWVWALCRGKSVRKEHFHSQGEACRMNKAGRSIFYQEWEKQAPRMRRHLERSVLLALKLMHRWGDRNADPLS